MGRTGGLDAIGRSEHAHVAVAFRTVWRAGLGQALIRSVDDALASGALPALLAGLCDLARCAADNRPVFAANHRLLCFPSAHGTWDVVGIAINAVGIFAVHVVVKYAHLDPLRFLCGAQDYVESNASSGTKALHS